jgi:hypothetical protein
MQKINEALFKAGFISLGLCSTLWVNSEGVFRAGIFRYLGQLHLVVFIGHERYWIVQVLEESVEICLRGGLTLHELAHGNECPFVLKSGTLLKARWADKIYLWWVLRINQPNLLPNYYYLWNEYCFSK